LYKTRFDFHKIVSLWGILRESGTRSQQARGGQLTVGRSRKAREAACAAPFLSRVPPLARLREFSKSRNEHQSVCEHLRNDDTRNFFLVSIRLTVLFASYPQNFFSATRIDWQSDGSIDKIRVGVIADEEKDKWQKDKE
jgi:hypothetical protein